jgi:hypothetical protein
MKVLSAHGRINKGEYIEFHHYSDDEEEAVHHKAHDADSFVQNEVGKSRDDVKANNAKDD